MKSLIKSLAVFIALTIGFSSLTSCSLDASADQNNSKPTAKSNSSSRTNANDPSTYPPLASAIANADMEFVDSGKTGKLVDRKGSVVLVNLWAIWCGPCRAEMPQLVALQDKFRDKGFQVIGMNVGKDQDSNEPESIDAIKEFGEKMKLNYELGRMDRATASQYYKLAQMDGIPISILIDRDGRLRGVFRGGGSDAIAQLKTSLDRALAQ